MRACMCVDNFRCCSLSRYSAQAVTGKSGWAVATLENASSAVRTTMVRLHESTKLPWWATIALCGAALRVAFVPFSVKASGTGTCISAGHRPSHVHIDQLLGDAAVTSLSPRLAHVADRKQQLHTFTTLMPKSKIRTIVSFAQVRAKLACFACIVRQMQIIAIYMHNVAGAQRCMQAVRGTRDRLDNLSWLVASKRITATLLHCRGRLVRLASPAVKSPHDTPALSDLNNATSTSLQVGN